MQAAGAYAAVANDAVSLDASTGKDLNSAKTRYPTPGPGKKAGGGSDNEDGSGKPAAGGGGGGYKGKNPGPDPHANLPKDTCLACRKKGHRRDQLVCKESRDYFARKLAEAVDGAKSGKT